MSNLLFFRHSLAYRSAAVEMMRKARAMPQGSERRAARQFARALKDLAKTEAWLEGQAPRFPSTAYGAEHRRNAVSQHASKQIIAIPRVGGTRNSGSESTAGQTLGRIVK